MYFLSKLAIYLLIKFIDSVFDLLQGLNRKLKVAFRKKKRELKTELDSFLPHEDLTAEASHNAAPAECVGDCCSVERDFKASEHQ